MAFDDLGGTFFLFSADFFFFLFNIGTLIKVELRLYMVLEKS